MDLIVLSRHPDCADGKSLNAPASDNTLTVNGACETVTAEKVNNKIAFDRII